LLPTALSKFMMPSDVNLMHWRLGWAAVLLLDVILAGGAFTVICFGFSASGGAGESTCHDWVLQSFNIWNVLFANENTLPIQQ
jgi:hypothetical protein